MGFRKTNDLANTKLFAAVLGGAGKGKTYSIKSLLTAGRTPMIINTDDGNLTLADEQINMVDIRSYDPYESEPSDTNLKKLIHWFQNDGGNDWPFTPSDFDTVVIDMNTTLQHYLVDAALAKHSEDTRKGWGEVKAFSKWWHDFLRYKISQDVILLHHMALTEDKATERIIVRSAFQGSTKDMFSHWPDEVYLADVAPIDGEDKYVWYTNKSRRYDVKSRIGEPWLPTIVEQDWGTVFEALNEKVRVTGSNRVEAPEETVKELNTAPKDEGKGITVG